MKRKVLVIWNDKYHHDATYAPTVKTVFGGGDWELSTTRTARSLIKKAEPPELAVFLSAGQPRADLPPKDQSALCGMVRDGMNALFIHAGLTRIKPDTPMYELTRGYFIMHPADRPPVYCRAPIGVAHPVTDGAEPFSAPDEHYFCYVDVDHATPFLCSRSPAGTEIAGWTHEQGKGRVCCVTPGHTAEMLAAMTRIIINAAAWCVGER